jgi:hypothetical protein
VPGYATGSAQYHSVQSMLPQLLCWHCSFLHANSNIELMDVSQHHQIPELWNFIVLFSVSLFGPAHWTHIPHISLFGPTHWTHIPHISPLRCCINGRIRDGTGSESQRFHDLTFGLSNARNWTRVDEYVARTAAAKFDFWALLIAACNLESVRWSSGIGADWTFTSQVTKIPHTICLAPVKICNQISYLLTFFMKHSSSWEANRFAASQEIPMHFMEPEGSLPQSHVPATCL